MRSRATHAVDGAKVRSHIAALATACLLNLTGAVQADLAPAQQSLVDGKIARDSADLFYTIAGASGDYVLVLSGGPGEDIRSMQGVADELGKKYRCIMWEQRLTSMTERRRCRWPRNSSLRITISAFRLPFLKPRESMTSGRNSERSLLPSFSFKGDRIWQAKRMFAKRTR